MGKKVEIENLSRSTLIFPAYREEAGSLVPDYDHDIVVGDRENTEELFTAKGVTPSRRHPLKSTLVDQEQIDRLHPNVKRVFDACIKGDPDRKVDGKRMPLAPSIRLRAA